jgi:hypothetical protein
LSQIQTQATLLNLHHLFIILIGKMSLLRGTGVPKSKFKFTWYKQTGEKLGSKKAAKGFDYEDSLEIVDRFSQTDCTNINMREIYNSRLALGVFESRPAGATKNVRKTLLLQILPSIDEEGKYVIQALKDLSEHFSSQ